MAFRRAAFSGVRGERPVSTTIELRTLAAISLAKIVPMPPAPLLYADHFDCRGVDLFRLVCESDLEGIVAKRKDGLYTPEETSWVKIKNPRYSQAEGRADLFNGWAYRMSV